MYVYMYRVYNRYIRIIRELRAQGFKLRVMGLVQDGTTAFSYSVRPGKLQLTWIQVSNTRGFSGLGRFWVLDGLTVHRFLFLL